MTYQTKITTSRLAIRSGTAADAPVLRRIFEEASYGLSQHLWAKSFAGEADRDSAILERMRLKIADPAMRFRIGEIDGVPAGGLLSYEKDATLEDAGDAGSLIGALVAAENELCGTHYINALAVFPEFRRRGVARALIEDAAAGAWQPLSLIAVDVNAAALDFYASVGFRPVARHAMVKEDWDGAGEAWLCLRRP